MGDAQRKREQKAVFRALIKKHSLTQAAMTRVEVMEKHLRDRKTVIHYSDEQIRSYVAAFDALMQLINSYQQTAAGAVSYVQQ